MLFSVIYLLFFLSLILFICKMGPVCVFLHSLYKDEVRSHCSGILGIQQGLDLCRISFPSLIPEGSSRAWCSRCVFCWCTEIMKRWRICTRSEAQFCFLFNKNSQQQFIWDGSGMNRRTCGSLLSYLALNLNHNCSWPRRNEATGRIHPPSS